MSNYVNHDTGGRLLNCIPSRDTERDWTLQHARAAGLAASLDTALPEEIDLREPWWNIADQGVTGSCVGWATADSMLRWHFTKANRLPKDDRLSARYVWMASKETDEFTTQPTTFIEEDGTSLKAALTIAREFGVVREEELPFKPPPLNYPGDSQTFYALAAQMRIAAYFNLGRDLDEWRQWLGTGGGPVLVRLSVDSTWDEAQATHGELNHYKQETARGGHAVSLVGYTRERRFIVRNSWGKDWGDNGYAYASEEYAQQAFAEAYGASLA
ncbi:C1 family peptidase [Kitasatospora sp. NPDC096140]|uniref:C1 family peptidase n=1 Tax=Kitasatospora sp. NPDC096140 TaxID=3155425 RepID=UPI003331C5EF